MWLHIFTLLAKIADLIFATVIVVATARFMGVHI